MLLLQKIAKITVPLSKSIYSRAIYYVHHEGDFTPKQHKLPFKPEEKKLLYNKNTRFIPEIDYDYSDPITLPGYDEGNIFQLLNEFKQRRVPLSPTNLAMLVNMFTKYNVMTKAVFDEIESQARRLKGQYDIRSIFGVLNGCFAYNKLELANFFLDQYHAAQEKFTVRQMIDLMETMLKNSLIPRQRLKEIWNDHFRAEFVDAFKNVKIYRRQDLTTVFDTFIALEEKDEGLWNRLIQLMKKKKGWDRIPIIEKLYSISGQNPKAQALFESYFNKMSQEDEVVRRYNLTEMRYRTPLEIIKHVQENPTDYQPKLRTIIPEDENAQEWNEKWEQYLKFGAVKQEEQIIKDKSKSMGFAIRERYEALEADNKDLSKMSKEEFKEMFGDYDETLETIRQEDLKIAQQEQKKLEQAEAKAQPQQETKGRKAKGKDKKGADQKEQPAKQKQPQAATTEKPAKEKKQKGKKKQQ